jgi:hypothetical protein
LIFVQILHFHPKKRMLIEDIWEQGKS